MNGDLKKIKKKYGEKFAHLCRELFPTILETEELLSSLIESKFYPNRFLYDDIINNELVSLFQDFINCLIKKDNVEINVNKTPYELLDEVGYTLYECKTEEDIQKFKKFYKKDEKLCTFSDNRLITNYVFFAVKKNVNDIKRENFINPTRQDEYGTSVISIQFTKGKSNYVSIKNRYNHTVNNPDATFGNDLDNIVSGLTKSFEDTYDLNICNKTEQDFEIPNYVLANDGKYYKYNYEINNIYYCTDNIIIDNFQVKKYEKDRYIIFDYFILDMKEKTINLYNNIKDSFHKYNKNIENIKIRKEKDKKHILLEKENHQIVIILDSENKMISYYNDLILYISNNFLNYNHYLKSIYLPNALEIKDDFMVINECLKKVHMPSLVKVGDNFLEHNTNLEDITFPNLKNIDNDFLSYNCSIVNVDLPLVEEIGNNFICLGGKIRHLVLPNLKYVGNKFLYKNSIIHYFSASELEEVGISFLEYNMCLSFLELEKLKIIKNRFLNCNTSLEELRLQSLRVIYVPYLEINYSLKKLLLPQDMYNSFISDTSFEKNFVDKQKKLKL